VTEPPSGCDVWGIPRILNTNSRKLAVLAANLALPWNAGFVASPHIIM